VRVSVFDQSGHSNHVAEYPLGEGCQPPDWLPSPGWQVTKNVTTEADEDNAVPGRIATAPLDFSVGHCDPRTSLNMLWPAELFIVTCVGDDGNVLIDVHLIVICPIGVSLAAAIEGWVVRLLQFTEPLSD